MVCTPYFNTHKTRLIPVVLPGEETTYIDLP